MTELRDESCSGLCDVPLRRPPVATPLDPQLVAMAWKLIEALAEPCEGTPHEFDRCRHCCAMEEVDTETGQTLLGILVASQP